MKYNIGQLKQAIKNKGYVLYTKPWQLNIIGVRESITQVNKYDDKMIVFYVDNNGRQFYNEWKITTKPGQYYLENPLNVEGTAILVPNQYINSHFISKHQGRYEALKQKNTLQVYRDGNRDAVFDLIPSRIRSGIFGINLHRSSFKYDSVAVNKWSAGCQVFSRNSDFEQFMSIVRTSRKFNSNSFTYTLLNTEDITEEVSNEEETYSDVTSETPQPQPYSDQPSTSPDNINTVDRYNNTKSKDIINIFEREIVLEELKVIQSERDANSKPEYYEGDLMPYIKFNKYTFNYNEIESLTLTYNNYFPVLRFSINDFKGRFNSIFLPTDNDTITLYLKSNTTTFKSIHIEFDIINVNSSDKSYYFDCIIKLPKLFTEKCQSFSNKTSFDLFSDLAKDLELGYNSNVTSTSDNMTWLQSYDSYLNFMKREIKHTYKDEEAFFSFFIDFHYNLNFVDLNNQFGAYKQQDSIITTIHQHKTTSDDDNVNSSSPLLLSNGSDFRGTTNYIYNFSITNNTGKIKFQNGYSRKAQFYDNQLKNYEEHDIKPFYETKDSTFNILTDDDQDLIKYKWLGNQLTDSETKNVHDHYLYSSLYNHQNIQETNKLMLTVYLDKANFHIYKNQSIPIALYEFNRENNDEVGLINDRPINKKNKSQVLLEQYSGHYVVSNIKYTYNYQNKYIGQELILTRREWPKIKTTT